MAHDARHEQSKRERCGEILEILKRPEERNFRRSTLKSTGNETVCSSNVFLRRRRNGAFNQDVRNYESLFDYVGAIRNFFIPRRVEREWIGEFYRDGGRELLAPIEGTS